MRLMPHLLLPALAAATADIYIHDPQLTPQDARTLSPVAARMLLAQRAGVEDYHSADLWNKDAVAAINDFGVRKPLFRQQGGEAELKHALVFLDGGEGYTSVPILDQSTRLPVAAQSSGNSTLALFLDLARQSHPDALSSRSDTDVEQLLQFRSKSFTNVLDSKHQTFYIASSTEELQSISDELLGGYTSGWMGWRWSVTAIIATKSNSQQAGNTMGGNEYGTYEMPNTQSQLYKRHTKRDQEEPLEEESQLSSNPAAQSLSASVFASTNQTIKGILPQCYTSLSLCQSTTHNCSGHGTCNKKYTDNSASSSSPFKDCYSCSCQSTTSKTSSGKTVTTNWGGPACQKKDVSVQFWLLAGFSVAMVGLVSFAVGSVWSMGDEELPSVIGAGVSGPSARR